MKYRKLADTGTGVSNLALGAMDFGSKTDDTQAFAILDRFVEAGGNLVDTANVYGGGESERLLGRWFAERPSDVTDRVVLATKARFGTGPDVNENGSSRRNLDRALAASLHRLGREKIDLYQLHGWDPLTPIEETLRFILSWTELSAKSTRMGANFPWILSRHGWDTRLASGKAIRSWWIRRGSTTRAGWMLGDIRIARHCGFRSVSTAVISAIWTYRRLSTIPTP